LEERNNGLPVADLSSQEIQLIQKLEDQLKDRFYLIAYEK